MFEENAISLKNRQKSAVHFTDKKFMTNCFLYFPLKVILVKFLKIRKKIFFAFFEKNHKKNFPGHIVDENEL